MGLERFAAPDGTEDAIAAYRMLKSEVPELQLALLVPESEDEDDLDDPDLHVYPALGGSEINALRTRAQVALQTSRDPVSPVDVLEALWKSTPVIARRAVEGLELPLADDAESFAGVLRRFLGDRDLARALGAVGHRHVREHHLPPAFMRSWLDTVGRVGTLPRAGSPARASGTSA